MGFKLSGNDGNGNTIKADIPNGTDAVMIAADIAERTGQTVTVTGPLGDKQHVDGWKK